MHLIDRRVTADWERVRPTVGKIAMDLSFTERRIGSKRVQKCHGAPTGESNA